jgi:hypothetical protein
MSGDRIFHEVGSGPFWIMMGVYGAVSEWRSMLLLLTLPFEIAAFPQVMRAPRSFVYAAGAKRSALVAIVVAQLPFAAHASDFMGSRKVN